jgi:hypothetical protein
MLRSRMICHLQTFDDLPARNKLRNKSVSKSEKRSLPIMYAACQKFYLASAGASCPRRFKNWSPLPRLPRLCITYSCYPASTWRSTLASPAVSCMQAGMWTRARTRTNHHHVLANPRRLAIDRYAAGLDYDRRRCTVVFWRVHSRHCCYKSARHLDRTILKFLWQDGFSGCAPIWKVYCPSNDLWASL